MTADEYRAAIDQAYTRLSEDFAKARAADQARFDAETKRLTDNKRDAFALHAMAALIQASPTHDALSGVTIRVFSPENVARQAYAVADAMLIAREPTS